MNYLYETERKENDLVIFPYEKIFNYTKSILNIYKKDCSPSLIIERELDTFLNSYYGKVVTSDLKDISSISPDFQIEFIDKSTFLFNEDSFLNKCIIVKNKKDAKIVLSFLIEKAIEEIRTPLLIKIKNHFKKD